MYNAAMMVTQSILSYKELITQPLMFLFSKRVKEGNQLNKRILISPFSFEKEKGKGWVNKKERKGVGDLVSPNVAK